MVSLFELLTVLLGKAASFSGDSNAGNYSCRKSGNFSYYSKCSSYHYQIKGGFFYCMHGFINTMSTRFLGFQVYFSVNTRPYSSCNLQALYATSKPLMLNLVSPLNINFGSQVLAKWRHKQMEVLNYELVYRLALDGQTESQASLLASAHKLSKKPFSCSCAHWNSGLEVNKKTCIDLHWVAKR